MPQTQNINNQIQIWKKVLEETKDVPQYNRCKFLKEDLSQRCVLIMRSLDIHRISETQKPFGLLLISR